MRNRGIVLFTSLVLAAVLLMFVTAAINLAPGRMMSGQASLYRLDAERAAQSGMDYAMAQLRLDSDWRGDKNARTIDTPDLVVVESNGNVSGLVRSRDEQWSQFRLRFNYQDGDGGADSLDEPNFALQNPFVSMNNLRGGGPVSVPRADGPGYSVTTASPVAFQLPTWAVSLAVEGVSGLQDVDPSLPEVAYAGRGSRQLVEAVYQIPALAPSFTEAGAMAGRNFQAEMGTGAVEVTSSVAAPPRMRVKTGAVSVKGGPSVNYVSPLGEIRTPSSTVGAGTHLDSSAKVKPEDPTDKFYELAWADVQQADVNPKTELKAGTYVRWQDGSLHYYDMGYDEYAAFIKSDPTNAGSPFTLPENITDVPGTAPATKKLVVTGDIHITAGNTTELNILTREGAPEYPPDDPEKPTGGADWGFVKNWMNAEGGMRDWLVRMYGMSGEVTPNLTGNLNFKNVASGKDVHIQFTGADLNITSYGSVPITDEDIAFYLVNRSAAQAAGWTHSVETGPFIETDPQLVVAHNTALDLSTSGPAANGTVDPPGITDNLTAKDLELEFAPAAGQSAVLSSDGDLRLTGSITGTGGTITSGGSIKIIGLGANLASQDNPINLYAVGDITFSTLDESVAGSGDFSYKAVDLKGIVYTQGNFRARLGSDKVDPDKWGELNLTGMLVAFGGKPGTDTPGTSGGDIDVRARRAKFDYNVGNLGSLSTKPPTGFKVKRIAWSNRF